MEEPEPEPQNRILENKKENPYLDTRISGFEKDEPEPDILGSKLDKDQRQVQRLGGMEPVADTERPQAGLTTGEHSSSGGKEPSVENSSSRDQDFQKNSLPVEYLYPGADVQRRSDGVTSSGVIFSA